MTRKTQTLLILATLCSTNLVHAQTRLYVDDDSPGGTGDSWATAFNNLQDALDMSALPGSTVNEIWVAGGTYKPDQGASQAPGDIEAAFEMLDGVAIYGHFLGTEATLPERDITNLADPLRQTILSGDIGVLGIPSDNSNNVLRITSGVSASAILDGVTIRDGWARTMVGGVFMRYGGGMYIGAANPTLRNCTFDSNQADGGGGGISNTNGSPTLINCAFTNNATVYGGGLYNSSGSPTFIGCTFTGNAGNTNGGGIMLLGGTANLTNCTFTDNHTATFGNVSGGGIYVHGGAFATLDNCLFTGNLAATGGGMNCMGSAALTNCNFINNTATMEAGGFRSMNVAFPSTLTNCIFWGNTVFVITWSTERQQLTTYGLTITDSVIEGCILHCTDPLDKNSGNDPLFVDPPNGDFHLLPHSPCIDIGDTAALPADIHDLDGDGDVLEPIPFDLGGNARVIGLAVDIGAYEYGVPPLPCPGDITPLGGNGAVNIDDLVAVLNAFGPCPVPPPACAADITPPGGNNTVNIDDLVALLNAFGPCP